MSSRSLLAAWLLSLAALGGLVLLLHARDAAQLEVLAHAVSAARASGAAPAAPGIAQGARGIDAATIDAIAVRVARRLHDDAGSDAASDAGGTHGAPAVNPPAAAAEAWSADQHAALDRASQLVDRVLDHGRLTRSDMRELRQELATVHDPGTTTDVYRRLIVALNTSQLVPEDPGLLVAP